MQTLLISDLHLQSSEPEITRLALALFAHAADSVDELFILGDLFEYWIGDDAIDATGETVFAELKSLCSSGMKVTVMHGNRDFLLGEEFVSGFGGKLVRDDSMIVSLGGSNTLLMHGDTLCTDDSQYQFYRRMVRNPSWQTDFLAKSAKEREATAKMIRKTSREKGHRAHSNNIADINADTLNETLAGFDGTRLIHGHTHRPACYPAAEIASNVERLVLGDWHRDHAIVTTADNDSCQLMRWDGQALAPLP